MSKKLASLLIKISANGAEAEKTFRTLEKKVANFGKSMKRVGADISKYVTVPLTAMAGFAVKAANTQLQAEAKLLNALKGRADVQQRLIASAAELQSRSTVGDEAIIEQQAFLAALGLNERQIEATIEAAVQLSAALGTSLDSATKNLAKTYGGLTGELGESIPALKNLTEEQLRNGEAIRFVNENYKGFAETAASTGVGPLQQLKNQLGDIGEQIGVILLPALEKITAALKKVATWFQNLSPEIKEIIVSVGAFVAAVGPLLVVVGKVATALKSVLAIMPALSSAFSAFCATPLGAMIAGVTALAAVWASVVSEQEQYERHMAEFGRNLEIDSRKKAYDDAYAKYSSATDEVLANAERVLGELWAKEKKAWDDKQSEDARLMANIYAMRQKAVQDIIASRKQEIVINNEVAETTKQEIGLIGSLEASLQRLEKAKKQATSESEIATLNSQIAELRTEIQRLDEVMPAFERVATVTANVDNALNGWKSMGPIKKVPLIPIEPAEVEEVSKDLVATLTTMSNSISNAMVSVGTAIGDGIGSAIRGEDFNPIKTLANIIGDLLQSLGKALLSYAATILAVKMALKSLNPYVAAVAGVAAIAAGAALKAVVSKPVKLATGGLAYGPTLAVVGDNPGASNDPEVIAPLSKLGTMLGGQRMELMGDVEFVIHGDTMRAVLNRENVRLSRLK
jgi:uncharacterized coiled-coil protein SlyX